MATARNGYVTKEDFRRFADRMEAAIDRNRERVEDRLDRLQMWLVGAFFGFAVLSIAARLLIQ